MKDYHVHSGFLDHTKDDLDTIVSTASSLGFSEIAVTEHLIWPLAEMPKPITEIDRDTLFPDHIPIPQDGRKSVSLSHYFSEIQRVKIKYGIKVLAGLEIDYFSQYEHQIRRCVEYHNVEFKLCGCHYVECPDLPNEEKFLHIGFRLNYFLNRYDEDLLYKNYFDNILNAVNSNIFEYIAHIDYLKKKFNAYQIKKSYPYIKKIFQAMIEKGVGLEVNIKGIKDVGEPYPTLELVNLYKDLGGNKICVGSDSHSISRLCKSIPLIQNYMELLKIDE